MVQYICSDCTVRQRKIGYLNERPLVQVVESYLDANKTHRWKYALWNYNGNILHYITSCPPDEVIDHVVCVHNNDITIDTKEEYYQDSEITSVKVGWVIYILAMVFGTIFKAVIYFWIITTIVFFWWRKQTLKKPDKVHYGINAYEKVREWDAER